MSDDILADIERFLESKNNKARIQFKTGNLLEEPAKCTIVERRRATAWINEQIGLGGFVVSDYWIRGTPCRNTVYTASLVGALSLEELELLELEKIQRTERLKTQPLRTTKKKLPHNERTARKLAYTLRTTKEMISDICAKCNQTEELCKKDTCPLWPMSPVASWRRKE